MVTFVDRSKLTGLGWAVVGGTLLLALVGLLSPVNWGCRLWCAAIDGF